jgi:hypothetical protein
MQRFCQDHGWTHNPLNRQARCPATPIHPWKTRQKALASDPFSAACHSQKVPPSKPHRCNRLSESHTQVGAPLFYRCGFESDELPDGGVVVLAGGGVLVAAGGVAPCGGVVAPGGGVVPCGGVAPCGPAPVGGCTPDPGGRALIPGAPGRTAGGGAAGRVSLWLISSTSKISSDFAGIGPLPVSPYPSSYGTNKRRLPPICIPSNPVSQPGIT